MVNLGSIHFQIGLTFNINVINGQNKYFFHISKHMAKVLQLWMGITRPFLIRFWRSTPPKWFIPSSFVFLAHFLLRGLTLAALRAWIRNQPQVVGLCPGHHPKLKAQNCVFKIEKPGPPLKINNVSLYFAHEKVVHHQFKLPYYMIYHIIWYNHRVTVRWLLVCGV